MSSYPFVAGSTLTANQLNQYAGLVYIDSIDPVADQVDTGFGLWQLDVDDVFSSDFANYRIVITGRTTTNSSLSMQISGVTYPGLSAYHSNLFYFSPSSAGGLTEVNAFSTSLWSLGYLDTVNRTGCTLDIFGPYLGGRPRYWCNFASYRAGFAAGLTASTSTASSTGFTLFTLYAWQNTSSIEVYGYNDD